MSLKAMTSMEPTTSSTAAGLAGWKLLGGLAGGASLAAALATFVVMCLTKPRDDREWRLALICTLMSSVCGGAAFVRYFGLQTWADDVFGLVAIIGIVFACGLPGWAVVRGAFNYMNRQKDAGLDEMAKDVKKDLFG